MGPPVGARRADDPEQRWDWRERSLVWGGSGKVASMARGMEGIAQKLKNDLGSPGVRIGLGGMTLRETNAVVGQDRDMDLVWERVGFYIIPGCHAAVAEFDPSPNFLPLWGARRLCEMVPQGSHQARAFTNSNTSHHDNGLGHESSLQSWAFILVATLIAADNREQEQLIQFPT